MRVIEGILVLFNVYKLHSSYIRHEIINNSNIAKLVEKRREAGDNSQKGTGGNRGGAGDVHPPVPPPPPKAGYIFMSQNDTITRWTDPIYAT